MSVSNMRHLTLLSMRRDTGKMLRLLINLRCVDVKTVDVSNRAEILRRFASDTRLGELDRRLAQIDEAISYLTRYSGRRGFSDPRHLYDEEHFLKNGSADRAFGTVQRTLELQEEIKALQAEELRLAEAAKGLEPWLDYDHPIGKEETSRTKTVLGSCAAKSVPDSAWEKLQELGAYPEYISENRFGSYYSVTYLKSVESDVFELLASIGFLPTELTTGEQTPQQATEQNEKAREALADKLLRAEDELQELAERLDEVEILYDTEMTARTEAELRTRLAQTDTCAVVEGWIPVFMQEAVEKKLSALTCVYEIEEPSAEEEPPVLLRNNRFAKNFEWVVGMYSYPKYGRFDPTFIMSIFYFIIFGLMFADVGYGLLLVICCFGGIKLLNPKPGMRQTLSMFGYCGISAILMGVLFGGWFGDLPTAIMQNLLHMPIDTGVGHFFGSGLWFNPLEDPMTFLILALGMGGVHLIAGMAVKLYIHCKDGNAMEGVCTIVPYWVLFGGLITLVIHQKIGMIVSIAGVALILLLNGYGIRNPFKRLIKGLGGLYGLVSYASDLLSYSRILALALVAAVIAKVINMITMLGSTGIVGGIVMVVVLIAGHLLNLAINLLGTFVHTARLQYLEFFGKFYEDGGVLFEPAHPSEEYSVQEES